LQLVSHLALTTLPLVPDKPSFPDEEVKVLKYWDQINAFHKQLELSEGKKEYTFYDGPPFATGLPHYGHIAAGTIKVSIDVTYIIDWRVFSDYSDFKIIRMSSQDMPL
jgi:isoleucyl-tRNA synthetase